jgi:hypothetical protein
LQQGYKENIETANEMGIFPISIRLPKNDKIPFFRAE